MELKVAFCCNSSWDGNLTSQAFLPYMLGLVIHPDEREQYV